MDLLNVIKIYTDGSCDTVRKIGGWAAIILCGDQKVILEGYSENTTHQRMELIAIIRSLEHLKTCNLLNNPIEIYSDSQYVVKLGARKEKLKASVFLTNSGKPVRNADLIPMLIEYIESLNIEFIKVKAHQKAVSGENFNRQADMLSRKVMRKYTTLAKLGSPVM